MAYRDQRFIGVVDANSIVSTNFIIGSGNFASGSNLIADVNISSGDETLIRPGQIVYSVAGAVPAGTTVQSVNADYSQITLNQQATSTAASDTFGLSTPSGSYLFQSASFNDPNNALSVNNISGSDSGSNFAIVGVAKRNNATRNNVFHLYRVSEVVHRNIGSSEISFFVEWGEQGTESGSGDILQTAEKEVAIIDLTDTGSLSPGFSLGIAGMETVKAGSEYAGYNIAITQYLSDLSGSSGTSATGSFSGSFTGSLDGTASIADFATTASYISTASFADTSTSASIATTAGTASIAITASQADLATTASLALEAITASLALQAESASVAARATTLSSDATASFADRATSASIADELSSLATASIADRATSASIADELSQLATASFADSATTASYALYAVSASHEIIHEESSSLAETASLAINLAPEATASFAITASHALNIPDTASHALTAVTASHAISASYAVSASVEIIKEVSSSFADTASFAQGGEGLFSGTFSGSNYSTEFTFDGDTLIVSGNVFVDGTLDAATKNFRINHPTMEGYYLIHSSLEGPERGIYYRGKLKTNNIIHLPDYWEDLTDETDITVQLTPIGNACQHFVKSVSKREIEVGCDCGKPHCYYIVHAQRFNEGRLDILKPKITKRL